MSLEQALVIHCFVVAFAMAFAVLMLWRRRLLSILHSGTWVLFAFFLYFLFNPLLSLLNHDLSYYEDAMHAVAREGVSRIFWILGTIVAGLGAFLFYYVRKRKPVEGTVAAPPFSSTVDRWTPLQTVVLGIFILFAVYSVLFLRTKSQFVLSTVTVEYDRGRIVGGATGYSVAAYGFLLYIVIILLYRGPSFARLLGLIVATGNVALRLYDQHDRASIVSLLLAVAMVFIARSGLRWQRLRMALVLVKKKNRIRTLAMLAAVACMAIFLAMRGHTSVAEVKEFNWEMGQQELRQSDTAMLPTLYVWSFIYDKLEDYDYALPLASSILFGWLPRQYFPWKDDLPVFLLGRPDVRYNIHYAEWFLGPKATIIGSFYGHGGIIGVVLGMAILGVLTRRLDKLVAEGKTDLGRAIGIVWMAGIWMMFGSNDSWVVGEMFVCGLPFFGMWIAWKLSANRYKRIT